MLIDSKFHDFYDSCSGFGGVDKTIVYNRNEILYNTTCDKIVDKLVSDWGKSSFKDSPFDIKIPRTDFPRNIYEKNPRSDFLFECGLLGFCGKLYPFVVIFRTNSGFKIESVYYKYSDLESDPKYATYISNYREKYKRFIWDTITSSPKMFFEHYSKKENVELFQKFNVPVFIQFGYYMDPKGKHWFWPQYKSSTDYEQYCHLNPCLKTFQFYKMFNPFSAFQEIQMFISGVLGNKEKDTVGVSDKDLLLSKGFDSKYSFRKEPKNGK